MVLMRPVGICFYEIDFTVLLLFVAYLLPCLPQYSARGEVLLDVARTETRYILTDKTDSISILSGRLATETNSISRPASGGIAMETDIIGCHALRRSLHSEYTVYR